MERVYRAYTGDEIAVEAFGHLYRPLDERLKQLDEEIPRLQGETDFLRIQYLSSDEILSAARDLSSRWAKLTFEEKRQIVETVVERIEIGEDEIEIHLS